MVDLATDADLDAYLRSLDRFGIRLGLDAMREVCKALDHPEQSFRSVIVAGTNGKGSVTAMAEAALRAAGHRTGRYTSPHLVAVEERVAIDGHPIEPMAFRQAVQRVQQTVDDLLADGRLSAQPTYFEVTTAAAFLAFRSAAVHVAVLEVGLGGQYDATNVVTPVAAAITSIDLDHQAHLGDSLASIAREKAGVIKPGGLVVIGEQVPDVRTILHAVCHQRQASSIDAVDGSSVAVRVTADGTTLSLTTPVRTYEPIALALAGRHQAVNAVTAVRLLEALDARQLAVSAPTIVSGLRDAVWRGRLEWVTRPAGRVLLDAAHNPAAARALAAFLAETNQPRLPFVLAVMRDKDVDGIIDALAPHADRVVSTTLPGARALPADELAARVRARVRRVAVDTAADPGTALDHAFAHADRVCVTGSIHLVGHLIGELAPNEAARRAATTVTRG